MINAGLQESAAFTERTLHCVPSALLGAWHFLSAVRLGLITVPDGVSENSLMCVWFTESSVSLARPNFTRLTRVEIVDLLE